MEIVYLRPPDEVRRYDQELLHREDDLRVTLLERDPEADPWRIGDGVILEGGSSLVWFTFPGRRYEIAAFYDPDDRFLGHYTNFVETPRMEDGRWEITDQFLDLWLPADGSPTLLDRDEFREARERGWIEPEEARKVERLAILLLDRSRSGAWPPERVRRWSRMRPYSMRLLRDAPGLYRANLISNRIIAFGIYFLGAASLTSLGFAALTDAFAAPGPAQTAWVATLGVEAATLFGVTLVGKLPATRHVRRQELLTEDTLFKGAAVMALAVLLVQDSQLWETLLAAVYGTLGLFLAIFAACRAGWDRKLPWTALAGLAVCLLALALLL
ncbi:MAG: DUF402 domain-containing protein [Gemmatimonadota bacterium]